MSSTGAFTMFSVWLPKIARQPMSPARPSSSGKTERSRRTGFPRKPWYTGITICGCCSRYTRMSRSMVAGRTNGWSASTTSAAFASGETWAMPLRSEVPIPSLKASLTTTRMPSSGTCRRIVSAENPSTRTISSTWDWRRLWITFSSSGRPPKGSNCLRLPMREDRPAASSTAEIPEARWCSSEAAPKTPPSPSMPGASSHITQYKHRRWNQPR